MYRGCTRVTRPPFYSVGTLLHARCCRPIQTVENDPGAERQLFTTSPTVEPPFGIIYAPNSWAYAPTVCYAPTILLRLCLCLLRLSPAATAYPPLVQNEEGTLTVPAPAVSAADAAKCGKGSPQAHSWGNPSFLSPFFNRPHLLSLLAPPISSSDWWPVSSPSAPSPHAAVAGGAPPAAVDRPHPVLAVRADVQVPRGARRRRAGDVERLLRLLRPGRLHARCRRGGQGADGANELNRVHHHRRRLYPRAPRIRAPPPTPAASFFFHVSRGPRSAWQEKAPAAERRWLFAFAGAARPGSKKTAAEPGQTPLSTATRRRRQSRGPWTALPLWTPRRDVLGHTHRISSRFRLGAAVEVSCGLDSEQGPRRRWRRRRPPRPASSPAAASVSPAAVVLPCARGSQQPRKMQQGLRETAGSRLRPSSLSSAQTGWYADADLHDCWRRSDDMSCMCGTAVVGDTCSDCRSGSGLSYFIGRWWWASWIYSFRAWTVAYLVFVLELLLI
jgi:hypothetical protein